MTPDAAPQRPPDDGAPPFLGRWRNVYVALLVAQAAVIGLLALLTVLASGWPA
jgi:hypothetical protein